MNKSEQLIACLEGEIAKRDARIVELESRYQRDVYGLNNEGDPIGGDPAGGYANDNARLRTELSAIKAQEPVAYIPVDRETGEEWHPVLKKGSGNICDYKPLYAAPAAPAADAGLVAVEWAKDAEEWGPALNEAGWLFLSELNEDTQKSALIFNNTKGPLRAAIMKYAEIVAANAKDSSHD